MAGIVGGLEERLPNLPGFYLEFMWLLGWGLETWLLMAHERLGRKQGGFCSSLEVHSAPSQH